jgi:hypothetical protein
MKTELNFIPEIRRRAEFAGSGKRAVVCPWCEVNAIHRKNRRRRSMTTWLEGRRCGWKCNNCLRSGIDDPEGRERNADGTTRQAAQGARAGARARRPIWMDKQRSPW